VPLASPRLDAVLFDLHFTLVRQRPARHWADEAWALAGRDGTVAGALPAASLAELLDGLDHLWARAEAIDPTTRRDLDPVRHRAVFAQVVDALPGTDGALTDALYRTLPALWTPYPDALPVLRALAGLGVRVVVLSNVGYDVRPVLRRTGIADLVAGTVLSFEEGVAKPDPELFRRALAVAGTPADRTLMVGDNWRDDGGAAALGIRTLIVPRRLGDAYTLDGVPALVAGPA